VKPVAMKPMANMKGASIRKCPLGMKKSSARPPE